MTVKCNKFHWGQSKKKGGKQYQRVHTRPFNLHPIFSFEKMGAFVTLKNIQN